MVMYCSWSFDCYCLVLQFHSLCSNLCRLGAGLSTIKLETSTPLLLFSCYHHVLGRLAKSTAVFGQPFVKWFTLCYQTVVLSCPVLSPVCDVGVLWPNGWMDQDETWHAGRPCLSPHFVDPAPPPPKGHIPTPPIFRPYMLYGWLDGFRCHMV